MVEISKYGSGEGLGRITGRAYSTGDDESSAIFLLQFRLTEHTWKRSIFVVFLTFETVVAMVRSAVLHMSVIQLKSCSEVAVPLKSFV